MNNLFISFEGGEGVGKSTQTKLLQKKLEHIGIDCVLLREPGGTLIGEELRKIIKNPNIKIHPLSFIFLFMASRYELLKNEIEPNLKKGKVVICDRYIDSTMAYQSLQGVKEKKISKLYDWVGDLLIPDITFLLDMDVSAASKRRIKRHDESENNDYFETKPSKFHQKLRKKYLKIANKNKKRIKIIDASKNEKDIQDEIFYHLNKFKIISNKNK